MYKCPIRDTENADWTNATHLTSSLYNTTTIYGKLHAFVHVFDSFYLNE